MAIIGNGADFGHTVASAQLGGLADVYRARLGAVFIAPAPSLFRNQLRREFAIGSGHCEDFNPGHIFGRHAFVVMDVGAVGTNHRAVARQQCLQSHHIGTGTIKHRKRLRLLAKLLPDALL